jgi:hypothetical protein
MAWSVALLLLMALLLYGGYRAVRSPRVQTYLTQIAAEQLGKALGAKVEVAGVDIGFFNRLILEGLFVEDLHGDTLGYVQRLHIGLRGIDLDKRQLTVDRITVDSIYFHLHRYQSDSTLNIKFITDFFKSSDTAAGPVWDLRFREVQLVGAHFRYFDELKAQKAVGVDYTHLDVQDIDLLVKNVRIDHDTIFARVDGMALREQDGFVLNHLAGDVKVSPTELLVKSLRVKTPVSEVALDLHYTYGRWGHWLSFVDSVRMDYVLDNSVVCISDVAHFAPALTGIDKTIRISGKVNGPVSALNGRGLNIWYGNSTNLQGDIDLDGLPNMAETFMYLNLKRLVTNHADLVTIPVPPFTTRNHLPVPPNLVQLGLMEFKGSFTGFISDFVAYGRLRTSIGELRTDLALRQDNGSGVVSYSGKLESYQFNVGRFLGVDSLGSVSLNASIDGRGLTADDIDAKLVGKVSSVEYRRYVYQNIEVNGRFVRNLFEGDFSINEDNIAMRFDGSVNLKGKLPVFNFHAEVDRVNLYRLNLMPDREGALLSANVRVDFTGDDIDNLLGSIRVEELTYRQKGSQEFRVNDIILKAEQRDNSKLIRFESDIMDAEFIGQFAFRNIPKAFNNILYKHLPSYASGFTKLELGEGFEFDFNAQLKNTDLVTYLFVPKLRMGKDTDFKGSYSSSRNAVTFDGNIPQFSYDSIQFTGVHIRAENPDKEFDLSVTAKDIHFTDSLYIANLEVHTHTFSDSLGLSILWDNRTKVKNSASIKGVASFPRNAQVSFHLEPSRITLADLEWNVVDDNLLTIDSTTFRFKDFTFLNKGQSIGVNGYISKDPERDLEVTLKAFDLTNLSPFTRKAGLKVTGKVSGEAKLSDLYRQVLVTNRLMVDSLKVNEVMIGSGNVDNVWLPKERAVDVTAKLLRKDGTGLRVSGQFLPGADRPRNFDLVLQAEHLPVALAGPYVKKVLSNLKGTAMAFLTLRGKTSAPELEGYVDFNEVTVLFDYLNTSFKLNDRVLVKKDGFYMQDLKVQDERGKPGTINGWVKHDAFKNIRFDATMNMENFLALNTTSALNPLYYGKAYGTGVARFSGVPGKMHLDLSMRTDRGSRFFIPLFGAKSVRETNFITFVKPLGHTEEEDELTQFQVDFANLTMDLDVQVTPDAEVQLIFDPTVGDIIRGSGQGDIRLSLDRSQEFKMFGEFTITKGDYLFTLQNIINKRFSVKSGGTVNWSGSPYNAQVNLQAVYGLRAALADLMYPDTNEIYQRRIQVECVLNMTNNLLSPDIAFDINLPNADQSARTDVINRIGVGNDQEMNRQVFGLLVLNKFLPKEDQNIGNETGGFFSSNSAELLSNQLSNWLSRISNDFDVGLNYRPGSNVTSDEVEVALSTQLFNNRIVVDGNVGVANSRSPQAGQSSSNIVGDVNIEYKITADGRFRVRAFNRSNDVASNALVNNNAPFTQGVGLSFRREFDSIGDLFKRKKPKGATTSGPQRATPLLPEELDSEQLGD